MSISRENKIIPNPRAPLRAHHLTQTHAKLASGIDTMAGTAIAKRVDKICK